MILISGIKFFFYGAVGKIFQSIGHWSQDSDSDLLGFIGPFGSSDILVFALFVLAVVYLIYADFVFCPMLKERVMYIEMENYYLTICYPSGLTSV